MLACEQPLLLPNDNHYLNPRLPSLCLINAEGNRPRQPRETQIIFLIIWPLQQITNLHSHQLTSTGVPSPSGRWTDRPPRGPDPGLLLPPLLSVQRERLHLQLHLRENLPALLRLPGALPPHPETTRVRSVNRTHRWDGKKHNSINSIISVDLGCSSVCGVVCAPHQGRAPPAEALHPVFQTVRPTTRRQTSSASRSLQTAAPTPSPLSTWISLLAAIHPWESSPETSSPSRRSWERASSEKYILYWGSNVCWQLICYFKYIRFIELQPPSSPKWSQWIFSMLPFKNTFLCGESIRVKCIFYTVHADE